MALMGSKSNFGNIRFPHPNLVETRYQIYLGINLGAMKFIYQFTNGRNQILIQNCDPIQSSEVDAHPLGLILFLDENNRIGKRAYRIADDVIIKKFSHLFLDLIFMVVSVLIGTDTGGFGTQN